MGCKIFGLIPRKPELTREEFHDYYRHPHGTIGRNVSTMRGYVQCHRIDCAHLGEGEAQFDAVAEIWLDNAQDAIDFRSEPVVAQQLMPDEPNFVDLPRLQFFAAEEEVITSGPRQDSAFPTADRMWSPARAPFSVKLLHFVTQAGNPQWAQDEDVEIGQALGALRHVRCRPMPAVHGGTPTFVGLQELWWPTRTAFEAGIRQAPDTFRSFVERDGPSVNLLCQAERFI